MVDISYSSQIQPEALPGRAMPHLPDEITPAAFGGQVGRAIEGAGEVAQQHADAAMNMARKAQFADGDNQLQLAALDATHNPDTGAFTKQGKDAFNLGPQYLPQFQQRAQAIIDATPDPQVRAQLQTQAMRHGTALQEQLDNHEIAQHQKYYADTMTSSVALAQQGAAANYNHPDIVADNLDKLDGALGSLADQKGWSPEMLQEAQHQAHVQFHEGVLTSMLGDNKVDLAKAYLDNVRGELKPEEVKTATQAIQKGEVVAAVQPIMAAYSQDANLGAQRVSALEHSGLSQDQQFQAVQEVERQRNDLMMMRRQNPGTMRQLTSLEDSIASGQPAPNAMQQIDALWHTGAVSDDQRLSLRGQIDRQNAKSADDAATLAFYRNAYTNSQPLAPQDDTNKKGVDTLFQNLTGGTRAGTSEWTNRAVDVSQRTGVIPQSATEWATANLVAGKPEDAASAADMLSRIRESNSRAYAFVDDKTRALADTVNASIHAGTDPQVAVDLARHNSELAKSDTDALQSRWEALKARDSQADGLAKLLNSDLDFKPSGLRAVPSVPTALKGEFDDMTRRYFDLTGGNLDLARQEAFDGLKKAWGVSQVNGQRELMSYAPEAMFPGLTTEVIREDISNTIKNVPRFVNLDPDKVRLAPDPVRTARTNGSQWNLMVPDQFGMLDVLRGDNGNPLTYQLPVLPGTYASAKERLAAQKVQQTREEDAAELEMQQDSDRESESTGVPEFWMAPSMVRSAVAELTHQRTGEEAMAHARKVQAARKDYERLSDTEGQNRDLLGTGAPEPH